MNDEAAPEYSLVVPAYNEEAYLPATLTSLQAAMAALPERRGELVVCDNNSTDRTAALAQAAGARVVFEPHNQIARARNTGGRFARGRYLIFVDADTCISPELLRATLVALDSGTVCGGGTHAAFDGPQQWLIRGATWLWNWLARTFQWACGAYVYCTREAFLGTGGFDERLYASEEIRFSRALRRWGKAHGFRLLILTVPILTSSRKMEWYGIWGMFWRTLRMGLFWYPFRRRDACEVWYRRPGDGQSPGPKT